MRNWLWIVSCVVGTLTATFSVRADGTPAGTITGQGVVELKRQPDAMRVQVDVMAKGLNLKEALAKLKIRREIIQAQFEAWGVDRSTVEFGEPQIVSEKTDRQRQIEMMMRQRMLALGKKEEKPKQPPTVAVYVPLKFELPLKAGDAEELLVLASGLEEKIKAADLGGIKDGKQVSPQDEELAQEIMEQFPNDENEPRRGEPLFLFVSKVSTADQDQALATAFQKAKREAARLARAAGSELGSLVHVDNNSGTAGVDEALAIANTPYAYQVMQRVRATQTTSDASTGEALGVAPGKVTFRVAVSASFAVKTPPR